MCVFANLFALVKLFCRILSPAKFIPKHTHTLCLKGSLWQLLVGRAAHFRLSRNNDYGPRGANLFQRKLAAAADGLFLERRRRRRVATTPQWEKAERKASPLMPRGFALSDPRISLPSSLPPPTHVARARPGGKCIVLVRAG